MWIVVESVNYAHSSSSTVSSRTILRYNDVPPLNRPTIMVSPTSRDIKRQSFRSNFSVPRDGEKHVNIAVFSDESE